MSTHNAASPLYRQGAAHIILW